MTAHVRFPTRHYPYRMSGSRVPAAAGAGLQPVQTLPPGRLYRHVVSLDSPPGREMTAGERDGLGDPFATLVLRRGMMPATLDALLAALDGLDGTAEGLPEQQAFVVAEGGQIPWSSETAGLDRGFRWVVARGRGGSTELLVSTAPPFDDEAVFLQVLAWDPAAAAFQYYERREGSWFWAGSSWDALREPTRGRGRSTATSTARS